MALSCQIDAGLAPQLAFVFRMNSDKIELTLFETSRASVPAARTALWRRTMLRLANNRTAHRLVKMELCVYRAKRLLHYVTIFTETLTHTRCIDISIHRERTAVKLNRGATEHIGFRSDAFAI
jgi:hypothetical protein